LAEAAKFFIGIWCDTEFLLFVRIELGSFKWYGLGPTPVFLYCMCSLHLPDSNISDSVLVSHGHHLISSAVFGNLYMVFMVFVVL
jgi:hypothetical protein